MTRSDTDLDGPVTPDDGADALRQTRQQLEFALYAGRMGSWEFDIQRQLFTSSAHSREVFGLGPDHPFERLEDVVALVHPDDREKRQAAVDRAMAGEEMEVEYRTLRPDGRIGWVLARGRAVFEDGRAVKLAGISLDITDRKTAEVQQRTLLNELNHRVKNTLAIVQSIALQTARLCDDPAKFNDAFLPRIHALAEAHDLLTEALWEGASLGDIINGALQPYAGELHPARVEVAGPAVRLNPNAAVTLHLAFHELATNAARHGALSSLDGRVSVLWADDGAGAIILDWRESGGPTVAPPSRRGFGSLLVEQGLAREMCAEGRLAFPPAGLTCRLRLPFSDKLRMEGRDGGG